jgi:uncharacterized OsmC-like protein
LKASAVGEIEENEDKVLVIRRIHTRLHLKAPAEQRPIAERVHGVFASHCPVYRSLRDAIAITTELEFTPV